ncbi:hypothetical protein [Saccharopolyspora sp. NPDC002686]|uniref:hypothetical protein n=1 Tax=Saccharopolyspora sp. NPDC002686 TaxID=3154541 RepID=UPI00331A9059
MGQVNQPSNLLDRIKRAEAELRRLWKSVGLASATISRGGLTLLQDAFLRMVDDNGTEILYMGPDTSGKQVLTIRREGGARLLFTQGNEAFGRDFWALTDAADRILVSDDAATGVGLARPWLPVPLYQKFVPRTISTHADGLGEVYSYSTIDASKITGESILWEGRASISHPWITVDGLWGPATGTPTVTYRLKVGGVTVAEWSSALGFRHVTADVSAQVGNDWTVVVITATASGAGVVACQPFGCYFHQTL